MKIPRTKKKYCKYCKKYTVAKVVIVGTGHQRSALKKGSKQRARKRGRARGTGNKGKYSKPAISKWKRKTKNTKKTNLLYRCETCKKSTLQKKGKRAGKVVYVEAK